VEKGRDEIRPGGATARCSAAGGLFSRRRPFHSARLRLDLLDKMGFLACTRVVCCATRRPAVLACPKLTASESLAPPEALRNCAMSGTIFLRYLLVDASQYEPFAFLFFRKFLN